MITFIKNKRYHCEIFLIFFLSIIVRKGTHEYITQTAPKHTLTHTLTATNILCFGHRVDDVIQRESQTNKPINPPTHAHRHSHTHSHRVHSNSPGYEYTDKVYSLSDSPAAPSASDMQKIVMADLFDMKRWEGNITAGNV